MLKVQDHQVAGHKAGNGKLGPLIDDSGHLYKPLRGDEDGSNEVSFYASFSSEIRIPGDICRFFPNFVALSLAFDVSGLQPHLVLQDLNLGRVNSSAMDIKIELDSKPDCAFASFVYGGSTGILAQLLELKAWFEDQTTYRFYSCSVLWHTKKSLYQMERALIDFAHVVGGKGVIDHNFLGWFLLVNKFISEISENGDADNLQDICPTDTKNQKIFINGFLCKNPANITASDFKSSLLNHGGDTDNFYHSSMNTITAAEFPGLNTLGISASRTDLEEDGLVAPHAHPRASEMMFVSAGVVVAGFVDSNNQVFQKVLHEARIQG
ncbi:unnamed protein product [Fraxinus pennsylvanica]|uniref:Cupin type-1 domain-containing protein n=1 Tax=Fraxinus pennsylvanica TaxID=56036 RepID=A0AAD2DU33_9LAMI|nr:unnamed protein product [Fraxinus pennsylvanica]